MPRINTAEWEMYITAQGPRLRNDLNCVEWDVNHTIYNTRSTKYLLGVYKHAPTLKNEGQNAIFWRFFGL